ARIARGNCHNLPTLHDEMAEPVPETDVGRQARVTAVGPPRTRDRRVLGRFLPPDRAVTAPGGRTAAGPGRRAPPPAGPGWAPGASAPPRRGGARRTSRGPCGGSGERRLR